MEKIAYGYQRNKNYIKEFPVPTHYNAIQKFQNINLDSIIDPDTSVFKNLKKDTQIKYIGKNPEEIPYKEEIDILIISCPPVNNKLDLIKSFPNIKGLILKNQLADQYLSQKKLQDT